MGENLFVSPIQYKGETLYRVFHRKTNHMVSVYTARHIAEQFLVEAERIFDFEGYVEAIASGCELSPWNASRIRLTQRSHHKTFHEDYYNSRSIATREDMVVALEEVRRNG